MTSNIHPLFSPTVARLSPLYNHPKLLPLHLDPSHHLIFYNPSSAWVKAAIELDIPTYFLGGEFKKKDHDLARVPGSSHSMEKSMSMILNRLKKLGHSKILIPYEYGKDPGRAQVKKSLKSIFDGHLSAEQCELSLPVFEELNPDSWLAYWHSEFSRDRPTVVIVLSRCALQSIYGYALREGIDLTKDLSIVSLYGDDFFEWYYPRPTYLKYPYRKALLDFRDWVRKDSQRRKHTFLKLEWRDGDTLRMANPPS